MAVPPHSHPERRLTLVASDVAPIGGMERVAFEVCTRLLERGWHLTVIARSCALPAQEGLRFVRIRSPSRPVSLALLSDFVLGALALRRHRDGIVQTNNPTLPSRVDVVHVHFCEAAFRREAGFSRSRRSSPLYRLNSWLATNFALICERWCYRPGRIRRAVCVSHGVAREVAELYPRIADRVRTIQNGVDPEAFVRQEDERPLIRAELGLADEERLVLFVGGDWHRKGLRHAIEALAEAPHWKLAVLGTGDRREFDQLLDSTGVRDRVLFVGHVPNPARYYSGADAFLLPSYYEAFGLVGLEAAAAGLPLIVPNMSGCQDYVEHGVNGWLIERNGPLIAVRLRELEEDPDRQRAMGEAAARTARGFDWARITDAWEALYAELAVKSGAG